jgi:hypothetical protein
LRAQILDWLTDTTFFQQKLAPFLPLLVNPNYEEILVILQNLDDSTRQRLLQDGGFGRMLPKSLRSWLHPQLVKNPVPLKLPNIINQHVHQFPPTPLTPQRIVLNQMSQALRNFVKSISQKSLFRSTAVALGVLFIMLARSKAARNTIMTVLRVVALLGLGGTATGAALAGYCRSFVEQEKGEKRRLPSPSDRGMDAARQVLKEVHSMRR